MFRKSWEIVAWTYDADIHCPACTNARFGTDADNGWVLEISVDSEGNPISPVFASDDYHGFVCGDCGTFIV